MSRENQTVEKVYCDVCGDEADNYWWESITRNGDVWEENYAPLDLCDKHIEVFDDVANKYKQERYEQHNISDELKQEIIDSILEAETFR